MQWAVDGTEDFEDWLHSLDEDAQDAVDRYVLALRDRGPMLPRPYADTVNNSKFPNMRELRPQHKGHPLRVFYAFDPRRRAILLIGGNKKGESDKRFYARMIPKADQLYEEHLERIGRR